MGTWRNFRKIVYELLKPLGVPVFFMQWRPLNDEDAPPGTYITYQEMLAQAGQTADNDEQERERYLLVDIWSAEPTEEIAQKVRDALEGTGFIRRDERDMPDEPGYFHRTSTWLYIEEVTE